MAKKDACYHKVKARYKVWPSAYACVPENTSKALTKDGWKTVHELEEGEEIMTFNRSTDTLEFKPVLNIHRYKDAATKVVRSGNNGFVFECTANHKWVVKLPETKSDKKLKYERENDIALIETEELLNNKNNKYLVVSASYNGGTPLKKDIIHRDAFLLSAYLNGGIVTWKKCKNKEIYSCFYTSNKRYKNLSNFKVIKENITDVWCPETENETWVMMQETEGRGIITITGNSGALVKCRKKGASNWGKSKKK
jgi:hypothetical protein